MKIQAIIPTAGVGQRFESSIPKPLVELNGKPIIVHTLETLAACSLIDSLIVVAHSDLINDFQDMIEQNNITKVSQIVQGGQSRFESVNKGLMATDDDTDIVLVHDGARPLVSHDVLEEAILGCKEFGAVVAAVPVKPTIKLVDQVSWCVKETLNRDELWEIQTPQVFKRDLLLRAHQNKSGSLPTDDAALVEQLGEKVKISRGDYKNIKITTQEDLIIAEALINGHSRA